MKILIVNPNSTKSMTDKIGKAAEQVASEKTEIVAVNPSDAPKSIEGYYDEAMSLGGLLGVIEENKNVEGIVIACFDDTGLDAARCVSEVPVIGIGEAAFHYASMLANKFSVVTTLSRSVPAIEHNLIRYGLMAKCARVRASEVPVLDLEKKDSDAYQKISGEIKKAKNEDGAEAIVLGCAGMADLAQSLSKEHKMPVLDGVACAIPLLEGLGRLGLKTSKIGGYASPRIK